jgi:multidrug efflux pump subunit AcrA (membrane-fusion protein)
MYENFNMSLNRILNLMGVSIVLALPLIGKAEISPLKTVPAIEEVVTEYQMLDGQIEAVNKSTVSAQTGGIISKLSYDVGDSVEKGALIARISSEYQKSGLQQAQASVSEAKSTINSASAAVAQAEAATKEASANYAAARAEFNRVKSLYDKRILSRSQYDQAEAAMKSSLARLESAKANQNVAKAKRAAAISGLSSAKAGLAKAGEQLGYTEVVAPYSGIVTERHVELGEVVAAGTPIMTGISLEEIRVVTDLPQSMQSAVRKNNAARVYIDDDKTGITVKKLIIFPYADPATNAFKVRASLDSAVEGLFPGVFVKIGFDMGSTKHLVVPTSSIAYRSEVTGVYVIDEKGTPTLRQVRLGNLTPDGKIRILAGLDIGENVALDPVQAAVFLKQNLLSKNEAISHD